MNYEAYAIFRINGKTKVQLEQIRNEVARKAKLAMEALPHKLQFFIQSGSDYLLELSKPQAMGRPYSTHSLKKFLSGDFCGDLDNQRLIGFVVGTANYFNLGEDINHLFPPLKGEKPIEKEDWEEKIREHWKEKNEIGIKMIEEMSQPGEGFRRKLENAQKICFLSVSMHNTIRKHGGNIEKSLEKGGRLCMAVVNPNGPGLAQCSNRSSSRLAEDVFIQEIQYTLERAREWINPPKSFDVQVRLLDYLPSYAITIIEPRAELVASADLDGELYSEPERTHLHARLFPFRESSLTSLSMNPDPLVHAKWFEFFTRQFEELWNAGRVWKPV